MASKKRFFKSIEKEHNCWVPYNGFFFLGGGGGGGGGVRYTYCACSRTDVRPLMKEEANRT